MTEELTLEHVRDAARLLAGRVVTTPVIRNPALDARAGRLHLDIPEAELSARLADWQAAHAAAPKAAVPGHRPGAAPGYRGLYVEHVLQADEGCDFDFLVGCRGSEVPRHSH